jgi:hypothetical protein
MNEINWTIFSRDRSCQLELLLRSTKEYYKEYNTTKINVLYTYSTEFFKAGYDKLIEEYPEINFLKETNFKSDLISLINQKYKYTIFFVDDQLFKEPFSLEELPSDFDDIACVSLRLHPRLDYCYTMNTHMKPTYKTIWEWKNCLCDYGYVMSLDSHVFLTTEIYSKIFSLHYSNPNSLEGILACYPINKPCMMCYDKSKTINNPCNKVQTNNPNRHGNISEEYLNQEYLNNNIIELDIFRGIDNESCHKDMPIKLKKKL